MTVKHLLTLRAVIEGVFSIVLLGLVSYIATASWLYMLLITLTFHGAYFLFKYCMGIAWRRPDDADISHAPPSEVIAQKLKELGYMEESKRNHG